MPSTPKPRPWPRVPFFVLRAYAYWIHVSCYALFGLGGLLFSTIAFVLHFILPREFGKRMGRRALTRLFKFFAAYFRFWGLAHLDLEDIDALADEKGIVIAPNHLTVFDYVFITSRLPNIVCIAKASVMRNPMHGGFARLARYIPNDSPAAMVKQATAELKAGAQLLVFPEGTRMRKPPLGPFKGGFALIAKKAGVPIQTLLITTNSPMGGKDWPMLKAPDSPYHYRIRLGQRFDISADLDTKNFVTMLETYFRDNLPPDPRHADLPS